jgi:restriction system protein
MPATNDPVTYIVRTPFLPVYSEVKSLIKAWDGSSKKDVLSMHGSIMEQTGTPQDPVDWSDPDNWIVERLSGKDRAMAEKTWAATVNPRYTYGSYLFINSYGLLAPDSQGFFHITPSGEKFLHDDKELLRKLDDLEGLPKLLSILAEFTHAKRGDLLDEWSAFLLSNSKFGTSSTFKDTLRRRLVNLVERGYVSREGNTYTITDTGIAYASLAKKPEVQQPHQSVLSAVKAYNKQQEEALRTNLASMNPYRFEALVKDLLEAMDYEDVTVTKQSGDKGIDVVATYQFGITQIREVVQVKRQQGSITRPILDQLRGALPYFQAIRGTIITLGRFAKGCTEAAVFQGAAPITLIDGDMLIELLQKHNVGIKKRPLSLFEVDESYFKAHAVAAGEEEAILDNVADTAV